MTSLKDAFFFTCLSLRMFTHSDQVSLSLGCSWGSFLISFYHDAGFSLAYIAPHLDSRQRRHLAFGNPSLAEPLRGFWRETTSETSAILPEVQGQ